MRFKHFVSKFGSDVDKFPIWKKKYIKQNRDFYKANYQWLDPWKEQIRDFAPSHQKMEWNCGNVPAVLDDKIIQFRASGIRVKMPTFSPTLNLVISFLTGKIFCAN